MTDGGLERQVPARLGPECAVRVFQRRTPLALAWAGWLSAALALAGPPAASAPMPPARGPQPFARGVLIDWQEPAVVVQCRVVLRRGPLEFLACRPGKEHESILRLEASAAHVYMALGLIGLTPGHPPAWDEARDAYDPPAGDLVELRCEWQDPGGSQRVADAFEWLAEAEYARPPLSRPWVFAGSVRLPDGSLAADRSGACIAVVDFSDSVLALSRAHTSRNEDLWVEARTDAIPPQDTAVRLVFRPAPTRQQRVEVDFRGALFVDGRYTSLPDLADLLQLARHLDPPRVQAIDVSNTLASDLRQLERRLAERGVGPPAVRLIRTASGGAD